MLKKQAVLRALLGFPLGVFINTTISMFISLCQGEYIAYAPSILTQTGSVLSAVWIQYLLSGLVGAMFAGCSVIFEIEHWSLLKQSMVHFLPTSVVFLAVSLICGWMPVDFLGILLFILAFFTMYLIMWFSLYQIWKKQVQKANHKLNQE